MTIVIFLYKDGLPCYNSRIYGHRTTGKEYLMAKTADTIAIYSRKSRIFDLYEQYDSMTETELLRQGISQNHRLSRWLE